ncbi:hypothetical protein FB008_109195 [Sinorhizobium medicae]|nr:hypothetical protein FB008_109195 [Sinorhizobium medicae]
MAGKKSWSRDVYERYPESDRRWRARSYEDERRRDPAEGSRLVGDENSEYFPGAEPGRAGAFRGTGKTHGRWNGERDYGPDTFGGGDYHGDDDYGHRYRHGGRGIEGRGFLERASDEVSS